MIGRLMNVKFKCSHTGNKEVVVNWANVLYAQEVLDDTQSETKSEITFVNGRVMYLNYSLERLAQIVSARILND